MRRPEQTLIKRLKKDIEAERRLWPWPQFGFLQSAEDTRTGFNMALDIVLDLLSNYEKRYER